MRCDVNVSVRRSPDGPPGTRCEIKNLNSLRSLEQAISAAYRARALCSCERPWLIPPS